MATQDSATVDGRNVETLQLTDAWHDFIKTNRELRNARGAERRARAVLLQARQAEPCQVGEKISLLQSAAARLKMAELAVRTCGDMLQCAAILAAGICCERYNSTVVEADFRRKQITIDDANCGAVHTLVLNGDGTWEHRRPRTFASTP